MIETTSNVTQTRSGCFQTNSGPISIYVDHFGRLPDEPRPILDELPSCASTCKTNLAENPRKDGRTKCLKPTSSASVFRRPPSSGGCGSTPTQQRHRKPTLSAAAPPLLWPWMSTSLAKGPPKKPDHLLLPDQFSTNCNPDQVWRLPDHLWAAPTILDQS